ncbi:MAG TPA: hypothetical protein VLY03_04750 [Bacteroidota bacterium]|nr:hypothetical protein [Bacteroidota bacterium]
MKYALFIIIAACGLLLLGCPATSLQPLFMAKDAVMNQSLVGGWTNTDGGYIRFVARKDNSYQVTLLDKDGPSVEYRVILGKIGECWFLDSYPEGEFDAHLIRTHMITQLWLNGDTMKTAELESDWLKGISKDPTFAVPRVDTGGDLLVIASTEELQQLLLKYGKTPEAFPHVGAWVHVK